MDERKIINLTIFGSNLPGQWFHLHPLQSSHDGSPSWLCPMLEPPAQHVSLTLLHVFHSLAFNTQQLTWRDTQVEPQVEPVHHSGKL